MVVVQWAQDNFHVIGQVLGRDFDSSNENPQT
jgi:hypothetical protein